MAKARINKHTRRGKRDIGRFRSMSEKYCANQLTAVGIKYRYERTKFEYYIKHSTEFRCGRCGTISKGEAKRWYLPDFELPNGLFIEVKGRLTPRDKRKMEAVKRCHPSIPLVILFDNDRLLEGKNTSKLRYGDWANKTGIPWAVKTIPEEWLDGINTRTVFTTPWKGYRLVSAENS